ncbi:MAG: PTS sugar transporter subunit IIA [Gemmatirosa sp.]
MKIVDLIQRDMIVPALVATDKRGILQELAKHISGRIPKIDEGNLARILIDRETLASTAIGEGVAIPHGRTPLLDSLVVAAGVCETPVEFASLDGRPVELCFLLVGPESAAGAHVKALGRISRLLHRAPLRDALKECTSADEFLALVRSSEAT